MHKEVKNNFDFSHENCFQGSWGLTNQNRRAKVLCQMPLKKPPPGDASKCWAPVTEIFDALQYQGDIKTTEDGLACTTWNDLSYIRHKWLNTTTHNFCRNPDGGKPWCYINSHRSVSDRKKSIYLKFIGAMRIVIFRSATMERHRIQSLNQENFKVSCAVF